MRNGSFSKTLFCYLALCFESLFTGVDIVKPAAAATGEGLEGAGDDVEGGSGEERSEG